MANRYKVPNLNVNYFLCSQGCARNEAADGNAGGRREGAEVCDTFWGVEYGINSDLRILFPDDIKTQEKLKVLWLYHGGSGDENDWMYNSTIAEIPDKYHIAVVLVNAEDSCYVDMANGPDFTQFLGKELPKILTQMFPHLSDKREDNYISGLSNGGYGCLIVGLSFPEKYAAIGAFSAGDKADVSCSEEETEKLRTRIRMFGKKHKKH